jgi:hypothetical protein
MRLLLSVFAITSGVALLLILLAGLTHRCLTRRNEGEQIAKAAAAGDKPDSRPSGQAGSPKPIPEEETVRYHVSRLLSRDGILGLLFVPILLAFLPLNAQLLGEAFASQLNRAASTVGEMVLLGARIEVTDLRLYGFGLSLALLLTGCAVAAVFERRQRTRWLMLLGLFAVIALVLVFEAWISAARGYELAMLGEANAFQSPRLQAAANGLWALVCASAEVVSGYWAIHSFLIPLAQAVFWGGVAPFRFLFRLFGWPPPRKLVPRDANPVGWLVRFGACVDETLMEPLRKFDTSVGALLPRRAAMREVHHAR